MVPGNHLGSGDHPIAVKSPEHTLDTFRPGGRRRFVKTEQTVTVRVMTLDPGFDPTKSPLGTPELGYVGQFLRRQPFVPIGVGIAEKRGPGDVDFVDRDPFAVISVKKPQ